MAAQHILEHSSYMTPDSDGFKCAMKNIVKAHYGRPLNVSKHDIPYADEIRESPRERNCAGSLTSSFDRGSRRDREIVINFLDVTSCFSESLSLSLSSCTYTPRSLLIAIAQ